MKKHTRVKHFSHSDLDGVSSILVSRYFYDDVDHEVLNYSDVNNKLERFIQTGDYKMYDLILVTDIAPSLEVAKKMLPIRNMYVLDHHATNLELNKLKNIRIEVELNGRATSGTELTLDFCKKMNPNVEVSELLERIVEDVNLWDTWLWKHEMRESQDRIQKLNLAFGILGSDLFLEEMESVDGFLEDSYNFTHYIHALVDRELVKQSRVFKAQNENMLRKDYNGMTMGVVFAYDYVSELGDYILENNSDLDFIAIIGARQVSLRSRDDISVNNIASNFGGGGHKNASGFYIDLDKQHEIVDIIFEKVKRY